VGNETNANATKDPLLRILYICESECKLAVGNKTNANATKDALLRILYIFYKFEYSECRLAVF